MISGTVIPNRNIMLIPLESNLDIVIMRQQIQKVVQQQITLMFCNIIDVTYMMSHCKHTLPSSHWIGAHNRMHCLENFTNVLGSSARGGVEFETVVVSGLEETGLSISCR